MIQRRWRESRNVEAVAGEVALDIESGVPLSAKLTGQIAFSREGRRFTMKMALEGAVTSIEVSGAVQTLDTTTSTLENTFEQKQLADLPSTSVGSGILNLSLLGAGAATLSVSLAFTLSRTSIRLWSRATI